MKARIKQLELNASIPITTITAAMRRIKGFFELSKPRAVAIEPLYNSPNKSNILGVWVVTRVRGTCDHNCIDREGWVLFWEEGDARKYKELRGCDYTVLFLNIY